MAILGASDLAARRGRQLRRDRGWTAKGLADCCAQIGIPQLTATVITNLETRRRGRQITVDEWLALAHILAVSPFSLLVPAPGDVLQVVPGVEMDAARALEWIQGRPCGACHGEPPEGFTCNTCGRSGA